MNRKTKPIHGINNKEVRIAGSFRPNGSSALDSTHSGYFTGKGFGVTYTESGVFTIALDNTFNELISAIASIQCASATDVKAQFGAVSLTNKTVVVRLVDSSAAAVDLASNASNRVHFDLVFRNSSTKG